MPYQNLKAEMARHEVTDKMVAEVAEVSPRTVWNWLNSDGCPSIEQGKRIQRELFPSYELGYLFD